MEFKKTIIGTSLLLVTITGGSVPIIPAGEMTLVNSFITTCDIQPEITITATGTIEKQREYTPDCTGDRKIAVSQFIDSKGNRAFIEIPMSQYENMGKRGGFQHNPTKTEYNSIIDKLITKAEAAIAFDAATTDQRVTNATSITYAHTVAAGSDRVILTGSETKDTNTDVTGITYNGVSQTQVGTAESLTSNRHVWLFAMANPDTGTHNVVITAATQQDFIEGATASYTGVDQTTPVDVTTQASPSVSTNTMTLTTLVDDAWLVAILGTNVNPQNAGVGTVLRSAGDSNSEWADSDGPVGTAGSRSIQTTQIGTTVLGYILASLKPADEAPAPSTAEPTWFQKGDSFIDGKAFIK